MEIEPLAYFTQERKLTLINKQLLQEGLVRTSKVIAVHNSFLILKSNILTTCVCVLIVTILFILRDIIDSI